MIQNEDVFEEDYLPQTLLHRNHEQSRLGQALSPATRGRRAEDVLISGPSGVGKTVLARHTLQDLAEKAGAATAKIDCLGATTGAVLRTALQANPRGPTRVAQAIPTDEVYAQLQEMDTGCVSSFTARRAAVTS